jgi:hypothetical protein
MGLDAWIRNQVPCNSLARVLTMLGAPPTRRHQPQPGDRQDRPFVEWFDGGGLVSPTGGPNEYYFNDGVRADWHWHSPRLHIEIRWPDGRVVRVDQQSDLADPEVPEG